MLKAFLPLSLEEELEIAGIDNSSDEEEVVATNEEVLDIIINNVVCSFSVDRKLDLRELALRGSNVEYKKGMVTMRLRPQTTYEPYVTASIWKSGKVTCTGATSEEWALVNAKRVARIIANLYPSIADTSNTKRVAKKYQPIKSIRNYRVVNVLATCRMPFAIKIDQFTVHYVSKNAQTKADEPEATYEPELHPGVTVKYKSPKATLKVFSTGSVTITAACTNIVNWVVQDIYPRLVNFQRQRNEGDISAMRKQKTKRVHDFSSDFYLQEVSGLTDESENNEWSDELR